MTIYLESSDRPLLKTALFVVLAVLAAQLLLLFPLSTTGIYKGNGFFIGISAVTWLPILANYLASISSKKIEMKTMQRLAAHILGCILFFISFSQFADTETTMYGFLYYFFIFFPIQLVTILLIELYFKTRTGTIQANYKKITSGILIIVETVALLALLSIFYNNYRSLIMYSAVFSWLPIIAGYLLMKVQHVKWQAMELIILFLIADLITVAISSFGIVIDADSFYELSLRLVQSYPLQLVLILLIDSVGKASNKKALK